jgi:hypothetical protein
MRRLLLTLFVLLPSVLFAAGGFRSAILVMNDDNVIEFNLQSDMTFSFADDFLNIVSADVNFEIALSEVKQWSYSPELASTADGISRSKYRVNYLDNIVTIDNLPSHSFVGVYGINGAKLADYNSDNQVEVSLVGYLPGVYIISVNGKILKVVRK